MRVFTVFWLRMRPFDVHSHTKSYVSPYTKRRPVYRGPLCKLWLPVVSRLRGNIASSRQFPLGGISFCLVNSLPCSLRVTVPSPLQFLLGGEGKATRRLLVPKLKSRYWLAIYILGELNSSELVIGRWSLVQGSKQNKGLVHACFFQSYHKLVPSSL